MTYLIMTAPHIEYWDNGKVAREKINWIIDEVLASIPSIWENGNWYIWWVDTWIPARWLVLRPTNNLIKQNNDKETYTDLQFASWLTPTSVFPIWVTVGIVSEDNNWLEDWVLLNLKTESWYCRMLYWESGNLYFDWWIWTFKRIATTEYVDNALSWLRSDLHTVAFTWKSSDLDNDYWFTAVPLMTFEEYEQTPWTWGDDKEYLIYDIQN